LTWRNKGEEKGWLLVTGYWLLVIFSFGWLEGWMIGCFFTSFRLVISIHTSILPSFHFTIHQSLITIHYSLFNQQFFRYSFIVHRQPDEVEAAVQAAYIHAYFFAAFGNLFFEELAAIHPE